MFSEILKINPRLDNSDLNKMERSLTQRFGRVAKKFGDGLKGAFKFGAIGGIALGLIDKVLNPLKEVQEAIDRTLNQADDLVTNARQFGTTAGKLFKLGAVAKSTGVDQDALYMLINKFQNKVAEAAADPTKETAVSRFVGMGDTADAFFNFVQSLNSLQKNDKNAALRIEQEVFGEKQILKIADFLATDMNQQLKELRLNPAEAYTARIQKAGDLNDKAGILTARREAEDFYRKAGMITEGMLGQRDQQLRNELNRENIRIRSYTTLMKVSETSAAILSALEGVALVKLSEGVSVLTNMHNDFKKSMLGRAMRGFFGTGE